MMYTLSLHDALPILVGGVPSPQLMVAVYSVGESMVPLGLPGSVKVPIRAEVQTSELQSRFDNVGRHLLFKVTFGSLTVIEVVWTGPTAGRLWWVTVRIML